MPTDFRLRPESDETPLPTGARLVKSCARCQTRKVKCDGAIPSCGPCNKAKLPDCNVSDCVLWTQRHVEQLEARIKWLQGLVAHTYEADRWIAGVKTGTTLQPKPQKEYSIEPLVEEVGLLSLRANGSYIGSMSGVTLTRLITSALRLEGQEELSFDSEMEGLNPVVLRAPYPPRALAVIYVRRYLARTHRWYPFLDLNRLATDLVALYDRKTRLDNFGRFSLNMVFAIAAPDANDQYSPEEYYRSAVGTINPVLAASNVDSVRAMLLLCVYGLGTWEKPSLNCWQVIGQAIRLCIELGYHRHYGGGDNEPGRKLWWATYCLERQIASGVCRVLAIRKEAIDQYYPRELLVHLPQEMATFLGSERVTIDYKPALHMIEQRSLLGEILECVYTTRPRDRPGTTLEETSARVLQIQTRLASWAQEIPSVTNADTVERLILNLAFHQATLLLYRPSPSFPTPPAEVLDLCMGAARAVITIGARTMEYGLVDDILPGFSGAQTMFFSGLTLLYCSWAAPSTPHALKTDDTELDTALRFLNSPRTQQYHNILTTLGTRFGRITSGFDTEASIRAAQELGLWGFEGLELDAEAVAFVSELMNAA